MGLERTSVTMNAITLQARLGCSRCMTPLARQEILYSASAAVLCARCFDQDDLAVQNQRAAGFIVESALTSLGAGLLTLAGFSVIIALLVSTAGLISGVYALRSLLPSNRRFAQLLSLRKRIVVGVCASVGLLLAMYTFVFVAVILPWKLFA